MSPRRTRLVNIDNHHHTRPHVNRLGITIRRIWISMIAAVYAVSICIIPSWFYYGIILS